MNSTIVGSMPIFGVSDFVAIFNQSLDALYPSVVIVGELSNFRISKGMWVYFDLKDEMASVRFFGTTRALPGPLEDGMVLEVFGRPYLHPKFGFSIQIDSVQVSGEGSIKKAQNLLAEKLKKEGLFDESRKRQVPFPPTEIGLITSSESAAYSDFDKIIKARWPNLSVELYDVQVQGETAPAGIVAAIEAANQRVDVLEALVLIRGGGSSDDLRAFDHEHVVRAIAASRIPTVVAIGHERDVSLAELAADVRASTPSNAAELLVPDRVAELKHLQQMKTGLKEAVASRMTSEKREIAYSRERLDQLLRAALAATEQHLATSKRFFELLDPKQPLKRGFALVRDTKGGVVRSAVAARTLSELSLEFGDGDLSVKLK